MTLNSENLNNYSLASENSLSLSLLFQAKSNTCVYSLLINLSKQQGIYLD